MIIFISVALVVVAILLCVAVVYLRSLDSRIRDTRGQYHEIHSRLIGAECRLEHLSLQLSDATNMNQYRFSAYTITTQQSIKKAPITDVLFQILKHLKLEIKYHDAQPENITLEKIK